MHAGGVCGGDGIRGRIPVANAANANGNIVARLYRFGGGKRGNVGANKIQQLETTVDFVDKVTNLRPSAGGADEEVLEQAKLRAPGALKSKGRAVTADRRHVRAGMKVVVSRCRRDATFATACERADFDRGFRIE